MLKVFGISFILFLSSLGFAQSADVMDESSLMDSVNNSLHEVVICKFVVAPVAGNGGMLGKELGVWWRKRQIKKHEVLPLFEKVSALKSEPNASELIVREVELFEARLLENILFAKCPVKTQDFFNSVRSYIEFVTAD